MQSMNISRKAMRAYNTLAILKQFVKLAPILAISIANIWAGPITLYGGLGGHNNGDSTNDGALATVDQGSGAVTIVGHPAGVLRISGLAFDNAGLLWATSQPSGGFPPPPGPIGVSHLLQLNPSTGAIILDVGLVKDVSTGLSIADLAVNPVTGDLFGIRGPNDKLGGQGKLYKINRATGVATLVGDTGNFFGSIAFASNGTLYMSAADLDSMGNFVNIGLKRLNPSNAATLSFVGTTDFFGAFGIRPTDGVLFGGTGDSHQLFTIDPVTGTETLVGDTGQNFIGDLAFQTPEPDTFTMLLGGGLALFAMRWRAHQIR